MPVKTKYHSPLKGKKKKDLIESDTYAPYSSNHSVGNYDDEDYYREPVKRVIRPDTQLKLSEDQLAEEISRILTANDPNLANNISKYNYKEKLYKQDPEGPTDHLAFHFQVHGSFLHKESDEAIHQLQIEESRQIDIDKFRKEAEIEAYDNGDFNADSSSQKTGKNQFNYSERAAQTFNNILKSRGVATEPPPLVLFFATVTQWDIYDSYINDLKKSLQDEEIVKYNDKRRSQAHQEENHSKLSKDDDMVHSQKMNNALKILERMVNHNAEDEIFQDFKYWEDASDLYRNGEGSLLPLWRFSTERTKRKQVTSVCWNPHYSDLFAVGYGSYDFMRQGSGMICCFSLKNTSHPEFIFPTESGVMCLNFHPIHKSLLAVGCYDGTVMLFDVRAKGNKPLYVSTIRTGKHTDPVWQVSWHEEDTTKELNFFSISSDGLVASWVMSKNELKMEPVMQLKLQSSARDDPDEVNLSGLAGGCCFDFNKYNEHLFIIGTEEGNIHKCSKAYSGQYLETYLGHHMAVYAVKWNPFHPRVFISCSADWTVKVWDHSQNRPILSFDLDNAVGDVCWSPYSSTVFAAVSSEGKVFTKLLSKNMFEYIAIGSHFRFS